jgi:hypothetical protein
MKKTLMLLKIEMQSSSGLTPQFKEFFNTFKKEITAILKQHNCSDIIVSRGHFYISGFFTLPNGQIYYFSVSDVRGMHYGFNKPQLMYRTAKHNKDYTGGSNCFVNIEDFANLSIFKK